MVVMWLCSITTGTVALDRVQLHPALYAKTGKQWDIILRVHAIRGRLVGEPLSAVRRHL